jgi:hypothetical protein
MQFTLITHYCRSPIGIQRTNAARSVIFFGATSYQNAIHHSQSTAFDGCKFAYNGVKNPWLAHAKKHWAAVPIPGCEEPSRLQMFAAQKPE